ncbi:MAG: EscU/YscU/HrcU family type III secretion system export apparatus switch protein [Sporomusaceae bacterium]|nr:EscU/YscU/HrcU family type III secretion system export apparatus switch protein [Sporomusaceae bacterium]
MREEKAPRPQAVAISYDRETDSAPKVVAKGAGAVAEQIIARAMEHAVPVYKNQTLAGMLMAVELDREIPPELYQTMAEVLAHIYRLDQALGQRKP